MGDKRRYRATQGVIRWQRGIKGLWRCAKRRHEWVFIAFKSTPLLCNWGPFRRPLMRLLCPEHPFLFNVSLLQLKVFPSPFNASFSPWTHLYCSLTLSRVLTISIDLYGFSTTPHRHLTSLWHLWRPSLPFNAFRWSSYFFRRPLTPFWWILTPRQCPLSTTYCYLPPFHHHL